MNDRQVSGRPRSPSNGNLWANVLVVVTVGPSPPYVSGRTMRQSNLEPGKLMARIEIAGSCRSAEPMPIPLQIAFVETLHRQIVSGRWVALLRCSMRHPRR